MTIDPLHCVAVAEMSWGERELRLVLRRVYAHVLVAGRDPVQASRLIQSAAVSPSDPTRLRYRKSSAWIAAYVDRGCWRAAVVQRLVQVVRKESSRSSLKWGQIRVVLLAVVCGVRFSDLDRWYFGTSLGPGLSSLAATAASPYMRSGPEHGPAP